MTCLYDDIVKGSGLKAIVRDCQPVGPNRQAIERVRASGQRLRLPLLGGGFVREA